MCNASFVVVRGDYNCYAEIGLDFIWDLCTGNKQLIFYDRYNTIRNKPMKKFLLTFCLLLTACWPEPKPDYEVVHARFGQVDLYIPKEYVKFRHTSIGTDSMLLQAWYPGAAPVPSNDSTELLKQGVWWKNVRILISLRPDESIPFAEATQGTLRFLKATEFVGNEFGLVHYTQPHNGNKDLYDVWLERSNGSISSRITCLDKLAEIDKPNCKHYFFRGPFSLSVSYDRSLLPEWKTISRNVQGLFDSFHSPEESKEFLRIQFDNQAKLTKEN